MKMGSLLSARCRHGSTKSSNIGGHTSLSTALVMMCVDECCMFANSIRTHKYSHARTHTHTYTCARTHTRTNSLTHARTHVRTHVRTHT